jgi:PBSX family phage terminase large subunit
MFDLNKKYIPLYKNDSRYYVITGGRGSSKSFSINTFLLMLTYESNETILLTRYTLTSSYLSIIPEFIEKINILGRNGDFDITKDTIINKTTGSKIIFKGIKTSSGNQTASLKSLSGITCFVLDEAEELVDEDVFDKIDFSIRNKKKQNRVILVLNPPTKQHFIYDKFFESNGVQEGSNIEKDDVTYIHTSYLDNIKNLSKSYLKQVENMRINNPLKYEHIIMGGWLNKAEGVIFTNWEIGEFQNHGTVVFGQDYGFSCFTGDTSISTDKGSVPIKDVQVGDLVLTSKGYKKVLKVHNNGIKQVIEKEIEMDYGLIKISSTFDHLFKTNLKWKQYKDLQKTDKLCLNANLMGKHIQGIHTQNTLTTFLKEVLVPVKDCIVKFGSFITETLKKGIVFTILMVTHLITELKILCLLQLHNTQNYITKKEIQFLVSQTKNLTQKKIGIKEENLFYYLYKKCLGIVTRVKINILQQIPTKDFVQESVIKYGKINPLKTMKHIFVKYVRKHFKEINTLNKKPAQVNVHTHYQEIKEIKTTRIYDDVVYDLTVEECHEYFANGILVHNCDPTTLVKCSLDTSRKIIYVEQCLYEIGLTTSQIFEYNLKHVTKELIIADSAEPRLISELKQKGLNIKGISKPLIIDRIALLQDYKIVVSPESTDIIKELNNYVWHDKKSSTPVDAYNHCLDPIGYVIWDLISKPKLKYKWS